MIYRQANEEHGKVSLMDMDSLSYSQWCCDSMSRHMDHLQESPVPCETRYSKSSPLPLWLLPQMHCYIKMNKISGLNSEPGKATGEKELKVSLENDGGSSSKQNMHLFELTSLLDPPERAEDCSSLPLELSKLCTNQHLRVQGWAVTARPLPQSRSPHSWWLHV